MKKLSESSGLLNKGFTLIELLIVTAVIGVLAGALLIALNPMEQIKRAQDAGDKESISTIGRHIRETFTISQNYPNASSTWLDDLVTSGNFKTKPSVQVNLTASECSDPAGADSTSGADGNICYKESSTSVQGSGEFIIYAKLASSAERSKAGCIGIQQAWVIFQSRTGKTGTICNNGEPMIYDDYNYY